MKRARHSSSNKKGKNKISKRDKDFIREFGESHPVDNDQNNAQSWKLLNAINSKVSHIGDRSREELHTLNIEEESDREDSVLDAFKSTFGKVPASYKKVLNSISKNRQKSDIESKMPEAEVAEENCKISSFENEEYSLDNSIFNVLQTEAFYQSHILPIIKAVQNSSGDLKNLKNSPLESSLKYLQNFQMSTYLNEEIYDSGKFKSSFPLLKEIVSKNQPLLNNSINELLGIFARFADVKIDDFPFENLRLIRQAYVLHMLNFLYHKSPRISTASDEEPQEANLDSGFSRPKILILAPFRNAAFDIVSQILESSNTSVQLNKRRFTKEFGPEEDDDEEAASTKKDKPAEYKQVFYGNLDDFFQIGIAIQSQKGKRHRTLKLFSDFYSSDIIVASPIALRQTIGSEEDKERDYDFLSSIQMVIVDRADIFSMQNWDHIEHVFKHLNLQPKLPRDCDFSRLMSIYSDLKSQHTRQTLVFSSVQNPLINSLFNRQQNVVGKIKIFPSTHAGSLDLVTVPTKQTFFRFTATSHSAMNDDRFDFFVKNILNSFLKDVSFSSGKSENIAIFISSYFDFVRLKRYFDANDLDYENLTEYTTGPNITRCRTWFFHAQVRFLLFTERFVFFRRVSLRGIRHLIFYSLPEYSFFYHQLVNRIGDLPPPPSSSLKSAAAFDYKGTSCYALFCKYDLCKVERIVGTERALKMLQSVSDFRFSFSCE